MQEDVIALSAGLVLKANSHPAMTFVGAREVSCRNRVGERKETGTRTSAPFQLGQKQIPFAVQHRFEPLHRNIPRPRSIKVIAHFFVVCRYRFCDRAGSRSNPQKPARHFLASTDFSK